MAGTELASPSQRPRIVILRGVSSLSRQTSAGSSKTFLTISRHPWFDVLMIWIDRSMVSNILI